MNKKLSREDILKLLQENEYVSEEEVKGILSELENKTNLNETQRISREELNKNLDKTQKISKEDMEETLKKAENDKVTPHKKEPLEKGSSDLDKTQKISKEDMDKELKSKSELDKTQKISKEDMDKELKTGTASKTVDKTDKKGFNKEELKENFKKRLDRYNQNNLKNDSDRLDKMIQAEELKKERALQKGKEFDETNLIKLKELRKQAGVKKESKLSNFLKNLGKGFKILLLIIVLIMVGIGIFLGVKVRPIIQEAKVESYDKLNSIDINTFTGKIDTKILGSDEEELASINISNYQYAEINNVSKWIQEGYIAVEDEDFKYHNGVDYKAILRASLALVKNRGAITQGGSTITQQVIKNNLLEDVDNKFERKIIEIFLAPNMEKDFSKNQIMEFYVNTNYYANQMYGVETASNFYFDKRAKDLDIAEAALLVGLSNSPSRYDPVANPEAALEKRNSVIDKMVLTGKITSEVGEVEKQKPINLVLEREKREKENYLVSYAIHGATLELMKINEFPFKYVFENKEEENAYIQEYRTEYSRTADLIRSGGYTIKTALNRDKQDKLQEILDNNLSSYTERSVDGRYTMQGAMVLLNNETHLVEAIIGGRGTDDEFNRGFLAQRQPGSAIKPFVVYAPALETGKIFPSSIYTDKAIENGPRNAYTGYIGQTTLRKSVERSINTVAWQVLEDLGPNQGLDYLGKLKFKSLSYLDRGNKSLSLGGFTYGATPEEMARAMSTLVNRGEFVDNTTIISIEYQNEGIIYQAETKGTQVFDPDTSYMMLDMLRDTVNGDNGTGTRGAIEGLDIAAKTGTTNDRRDAWFVGTSPKYSLTVWMGYDTPRNTGQYGGELPADIFREAMLYVSEDSDYELEFIQPDTIVESYVDSKGNMTSSETGTRDLFSPTLIERAAEYERRIQEQRMKEADTQLSERVDTYLDELENMSLSDLEELEDYNVRVETIRREISQIYSSEISNEKNSRLEETIRVLEPKVRLLEIQEEERIEKERQAQEDLKAQNVRTELQSFRNYTPTSTRSISEVQGMKDNITRLINQLEDENLKTQFKTELGTISATVDVELEPYREQIRQQEEANKARIRQELENEISKLRQENRDTTTVRNLYSRIDSLLSEGKKYGIDAEYRQQYESHKRRIQEAAEEELRQIEEERIRELEEQRQQEELEELERQREEDRIRELEEQRQREEQQEQEESEENSENLEELIRELERNYE